MHCCPVGMAMIGIRADQNVFKCAPLKEPGGVRSLDTGTVRSNMHVCPWGQVMVGLHADLNRLACQTIPGDPVVGEHVDLNTADGFPMHVCTTPTVWTASAMTGIRIDLNQLSCGTNFFPRPPVPMAPSNLKITSVDSSQIHFTFQDNNTTFTFPTNDGQSGPFWEVFENVGGVAKDRSGGGGTSMLQYVGKVVPDATSLIYLTNGTHACLQVQARNSTGSSALSAPVCAGGTTLPPSVNVGLGNGVLIASPDLTDMNYQPPTGGGFRVWWQVCNGGTAASGALAIRLVESGAASNTFNFSIASLAAGQCMAENTVVLTASGEVDFDLFINNVFEGGSSMAF